MRFYSKISTLEEREDLATLAMDEIHGTLTTYEMRKEQDNLITKEATFKASKKSNKNGKQKEKSYNNNNDISEDDEEVVNFIRRLKKGTDKYRGKLPLNFCICDFISNFAKNCPHKKNKSNEEDDSNRKKSYRGKRTNFFFSRKSFAPKKTTTYQMKMKAVKVIQKGYIYGKRIFR
jgi:hypothetical protein